MGEQQNNSGALVAEDITRGVQTEDRGLWPPSPTVQVREVWLQPQGGMLLGQLPALCTAVEQRKLSKNYQCLI